MVKLDCVNDDGSWTELVTDPVCLLFIDYSMVKNRSSLSNRLKTLHVNKASICVINFLKDIISNLLRKV